MQLRVDEITTKKLFSYSMNKLDSLWPTAALHFRLN